MNRSFPAQSDFRTVHLENARIAARRRVRSCNAVAREEPEFHQSLSVVLGQVDTIQDAGFPALQSSKISCSGARVILLHPVISMHKGVLKFKQLSCNWKLLTQATRDLVVWCHGT